MKKKMYSVWLNPPHVMRLHGAATVSIHESNDTKPRYQRMTFDPSAISNGQIKEYDNLHYEVIFIFPYNHKYENDHYIILKEDLSDFIEDNVIEYEIARDVHTSIIKPEAPKLIKDPSKLHTYMSMIDMGMGWFGF